MSHLPRTHPSRFLSWQMFPYVSSLPLSLCLVAEKITKRKKKTFWSFGTFCIPFHVSFQIVKILQRLEIWVSLAIKWSIDFLCYQCYKLKAVLFSFLCSISWVGFLQNLANCDIKKPFWAFSLFFQLSCWNLVYMIYDLKFLLKFNCLLLFLFSQVKELYNEIVSVVSWNWESHSNNTKMIESFSKAIIYIVEKNAIPSLYSI